MGLPLHGACYGQHTSLFVALYPEGVCDECRRLAAYSPLRILSEPDEEVTRGHRHHQALGGCLARVGQHSFQMIQMIQMKKVNSVQCRQSKGSSSCSATSSACPACEPLPPHSLAELPAQARYACCCSVRSQRGTRRLLWG
jgi:hypothetical protein